MLSCSGRRSLPPPVAADTAHDAASAPPLPLERPEPAEKCEIIYCKSLCISACRRACHFSLHSAYRGRIKCGSRLIRASRGAGRSGWDLRRVYAAVDNKGQMRPFDKDDVLFVGEKAVDQGRASADPCAIKNIAAKPGPAAVPVVAAVDRLSRADAGGRPRADGAGDRRALGGVLLAFGTTLDCALVIASGHGARASLRVLERAGE